MKGIKLQLAGIAVLIGGGFMMLKNGSDVWNSLLMIAGFLQALWGQFTED